jgi:hypothetical protein
MQRSGRPGASGTGHAGRWLCRGAREDCARQQGLAGEARAGHTRRRCSSRAAGGMRGREAQGKRKVADL